jgi:hypothetical protein
LCCFFSPAPERSSFPRKLHNDSKPFWIFSRSTK